VVEAGHSAAAAAGIGSCTGHWTGEEMFGNCSRSQTPLRSVEGKMMGMVADPVEVACWRLRLSHDRLVECPQNHWDLSSVGLAS
jgi:hypothetical protein